jgi:thiol-disulfide isomerase/thioredoxin
MNANKMLKGSNMLSNPLFIIVMLLIGLIIVLAIFRSVSPLLSLGFGINAHIGDLKGSFEIEAFDNGDAPVFAMYYAEWCGHCKRAKPEFEKLSQNYQGNIKILVVNAELPENKDLVKSQNIEGFPTIRYYPSGLSGKYDEYSGSRTYSDFVQYLGTVEGTPDVAPDNAAPIEQFRSY